MSTHPDLEPPRALFSADDGAAPPQPWLPLPYADAPRFGVPELLARWSWLHAGQGMQPPLPGPLAEGWALYHSGEFERAAAVGLAHGEQGLDLANQATAIYASYLEPRESMRRVLLKQVVERAAVQAAAAPDHCQALYWQAYALGRYSQGISITRALALGLGGKIKAALERVIALQPQHADAHVALAAFHAEVIDKVGALVARMTFGARAETAIALFERGLELNPHSPCSLVEYGRGLLMLEGDARMGEATRLYERAAALTPADARERLDVELARAGLKE